VLQGKDTHEARSQRERPSNSPLSLKPTPAPLAANGKARASRRSAQIAGGRRRCPAPPRQRPLSSARHLLSSPAKLAEPKPLITHPLGRPFAPAACPTLDSLAPRLVRHLPGTVRLVGKTTAGPSAKREVVPGMYKASRIRELASRTRSHQEEILPFNPLGHGWRLLQECFASCKGSCKDPSDVLKR
jgi:hypothetical protein